MHKKNVAIYSLYCDIFFVCLPLKITVIFDRTLGEIALIFPAQHGEAIIPNTAGIEGINIR